MHLTDEQRQIGKDNYNRVVGTTRRDFFKNVAGAGLVSGVGLGAAYFNYPSKMEGDPLRVGVIGTGDEGGVLIGALNPQFVQVKAIADIRPYSIHRAFHGDWYSNSALEARPGLLSKYGYADEDAARKEIKVYTGDYEELLDDSDVEAVIIALPLWLHADAAIKAMRKGKHVLTEKLMAWNVAQCKEMARVAAETGMLLSTGHQRHYSVLYDNAVDTIQRGVIGDIHHIRAQWHRGNLPGADSWQPDMPRAMSEKRDFDLAIRALDIKRDEGKLSSAEYSQARRDLAKVYPLFAKLRSWTPRAKDASNPKDKELWEHRVAQVHAQLEDIAVDAAKYGYQEKKLETGAVRTPLEELIRWRLWNRTGGGLMAELGSHQLDAAGIFISSQFEPPAPGKRAKVHPLSVTGVGGRYIFPPDRDVDDHVYCTYEYPGKGYFEDNDPTSGTIANENKRVGVTYSSINGNGFGGYGEVVAGDQGTLILEREQETMLYGGSGANTKVGVNKDEDLVESYDTGGAAAAEAVGATASANVSRGYTEEIEHWAWCIRTGQPPETLHCHPKVALADAVIALTSNIAMEKQQRIDFKPEWFDPDNDAVPGGPAPRKASAIA